MAQLNKEKWGDWLAASMRGDKNTYRLLLCELHIWLSAYFKKRIHTDEVEDLVQDTLLAIHNKKQTFDENREFMPWLIAVARHKLIDKLRRNIKFLAETLNEEIASEVKTEMCARHDVEKLLNLINPQQAKIISMLKLKEMTIEEVSLGTGITQASVKVIAHRGLKALQAKVKEVTND